MSFSFRSTSPGDAPQLASLFKNVLGMPPGSPGLDPRLLAWKYWQARADWTEPRSYVLEKEGRIVAHAGIWPLILGSQDCPVRGIQMIDWAASHEASGAGLALVRRFVNMFDFIYSIGGSDITQKILPAFGFHVHTRAWRAGRPLRPIRQLLTHQTRNWILIPRLFRNYLWSRTPPRRRRHPWTARQISPSQLITQPDGSCSPRPSAFFQYLEQCPTADFTLWQILQSDEPLGFFSLAVLCGQARIAGIWLQDTTKEAWQLTYALAQETAQSMKNVFEVVAGGTAGISAQAAEQAGLRVRMVIPVFVLDKKGKASLPHDFQFQLVDDDSAFRTGSSNYLT
jgi:hypothetical protein